MLKKRRERKKNCEKYLLVLWFYDINKLPMDRYTSDGTHWAALQTCNAKTCINKYRFHTFCCFNQEFSDRSRLFGDGYRFSTLYLNWASRHSPRHRDAGKGITLWHLDPNEPQPRNPPTIETNEMATMANAAQNIFVKSIPTYQIGHYECFQNRQSTKINSKINRNTIHTETTFGRMSNMLY